jgi:hypothetical protein
MLPELQEMLVKKYGEETVKEEERKLIEDL